MRKILGIAICCLMYAPMCLAATIVASSETTGQKCGDNCTWTLDSDGNLTVSGEGAMYNYSHPGFNQNETSWSPWYKLNEDIHNVVIENGITAIGQWAFKSTNATSIEIPSSVQTLGYGFAESSAVKNLHIPDTVTSLGGAFCHACPNLENLYLSQNISTIGSHSFTFNTANIDTVVIPPNATLTGYMGGIGYITTYCTSEQISTCGNNSVLYEKKGNLYYVYDNEGNISEIYGGYENFNKNVLKAPDERDTYNINDDGSVSIMDSKGTMIAQYSADGGLLKQYDYNSDGSVSIYDANGKLISLKGKRIFTVEEATALVSGKNTFSIRYR